MEFGIWQQVLEPLDRYGQTQRTEPFRHSKVEGLPTVPYGDFTRLNHLVLSSLSAESVARSLEENVKKSAIVAGHLS